MPKLDDTLLGSVVYLFGSLDDARNASPTDPAEWPQPVEEKTAKAASGVLVAVHGTRTIHHYVVTNRHVICQGLVKPRFAFKDESGKHDYIIDAVEDDWHCNILPTDLAIMPVRDQLVDRLASGISLRDVSITDKRMVNIGDDVAMIGRFYPISGGRFNDPVVRFGNIARWPETQVPLPWMSNREVDAIPVEMRSHSGYSGSPVFVLRGANDRVRRSMELILACAGRADSPDLSGIIDVDWQDIRFLGIDCGHLREHMAIVIPWFKVEELIFSKKLKEERDKVDRELDQMMGPYVILD